MPKVNSVPSFEQVVAALQKSSESAGKSLAAIFTEHNSVIGELFEGCRSANPDDWEMVGHHFHKAFRQIDVVRGDHGKTDIRVWDLLHESEMFWLVLARES